MNRQILKTPLLIAALLALLSGCATSSDPQPDAPKSAVQSSTGTTVSGYIDVGGRKSLH
jgi:uncharacterized lipoprotein YajG